jgi:ATP-dependent DNA helicase RecG
VSEPARVAETVANLARNNVVPAIAPGIESMVLSGQAVCVVEVAKGDLKPYQTLDGRYWIRVGSTNRSASQGELAGLFQSAGWVQYDLSPVPETGYDDLDPARLQDYFQSYHQLDLLGLEEPERRRILLNADVLRPADPHEAVSVGGLLIFGRQPQRRLPQASVTFAVWRGRELTDELIDKKTVDGTLPEQIDRTAALVQLFVPRPSTVNGMRRDEPDAIPPKVLREALVNAVCHRDYAMANRRIAVHVFADRVEVSSPGRLANSLTIEKLRWGHSAPRNLFLLKYLDNLRYVDGLGRGIPLMARAMGDRLELEELGDLFRVTLRL